MRLATDALNSGQQIPHYSHRIVGNIYSAAPSHCRSSLIKFRSIIAGFLNHLLLGFKECLDLCFVDQAALLPPTHNGHIPLDDETYTKHVKSMQASIQNIFASSDSVAKDLPEMETVFISQLRSAAGLGSFINVVLPGISSCMSAIRDIPTSFTQLIEAVRETASSFAEFGRCMLDFHHLVRDFGWGTPVMSANLENLLFKLEGTALVLWRILFYMSGANESRSMMWLKLHEEPPLADAPWRKSPMFYLFHAQRYHSCPWR